MPTRYVLTGAPGSGKTSILQVLERRGYPVIQEAATDVNIAELARGNDQPSTDIEFIDKVVRLQVQRQEAAVPPEVQVQICDRSPLCTLALAEYLERPVTDLLAHAVDAMMRQQLYERPVFFVRPLGFVTRTAVRRIRFEDSLRFEAMHAALYRSHGFEIVDIPVAGVEERADMIAAHIQAWT